MRRFAILLLAVTALSQTGCHGRVRSFFYRVFHCDGCAPYYGYGAANYSAPVYGTGAPGCCGTPGVTAMPVSYAPAQAYAAPVSYGAPVFGQSTPLPAPNVHTTPGTGIPTPMTGGEKK